MLTQPRKADDRPPRAAHLSLARITGTLNLVGVDLACPLILESCYFENSVNASQTRAPILEINRCHVPSFIGKQLRTRGDLSLAGTRARSVELNEVHIGGGLKLNTAHLNNPNRVALSLEGAQIDGDMFCRAGFQTEGEILMLGAHIGGGLSLNGAHLKNPNGDALSADRAQISEGIFCKDGFQAEGQIRLLGAHIGQLNLEGAHLKNPNGDALSADGAQIDGDMFCEGDFQTEGVIRLPGVHIGGQLNFNEAHLKNPDGPAVTADGAQIDGDVICRGGFRQTAF
jgi:hypothetical protein